ncbi:hypothetical protein VQL36_11460 [Chengkuizengella sp. SCS-71B]|uniref:hypothetical protein n=1 Tax=Chengkuizengella sp. SCS-71B TaxID=3115290 RepID=UPI0032C241C5
MPLQPETLTNLNGSKKVGINKIVKGFTESTRAYPENFNQALQTLIDNDVSLEDAQVGLIRNSIHSGFLDISDLEFGENKITLVEEQVANINGYLLTIPEGTEIELPEAPTEGKREDLVFLEAWFPIEGNGYEMSWRVRSVAGVDFEVFPEGIGYSSSVAIVATAQGGNETPLDGHPDYRATSHFAPEFIRRSLSSGGIGISDVGLYVAGRGKANDISSLKTSDGYVYAIPMFRIKRRNSGGYNSSNGNGAREYKEQWLSWSDFGAIPTKDELEVTINNNEVVDEWVSVGDLVKDNSGVLWGIITKINTDRNKVVIMNNNGNWSQTGGTILSISDRPDNLYSNIIDQRDIIDLRHKVSLTGEDYNKIMQEEFNRLLAGENGNVGMKKEYFGLEKAPSYIEPELQAVKVKGNDGVERELVNLLSYRGDFEQDSNKNGIPDSLYYFNIQEGGVLSTSEESVDGGKSLRIDANAGDIHATRGADFRFGGKLNGKYILAITKTKCIGKNSTSRFYLYDGENKLGLDNYITESQEWETAYVAALVPEANDFRVIHYNYSNVGTVNSVYFDKTRVYEITEEEYNLIDVDPEWKGDKLAEKFPYVNGYSNVIENLIPPFYEWDRINNDATILSPYELYLNPTGTYKSSKVNIKVAPNTEYTLLFPKISSQHYYDIVMYDESDNQIDQKYNARENAVFTTPSNTKSVSIFPSNGIDTSEYIFKNLMLIKGNQLVEIQPFVPYGKWYVPYDYANQETNTRFDLTDQKRILSDAQTSQKVTDKIAVSSNDHLKHIEVTQATEGAWSTGDTIKVKGYDGIVSGVIDEDTAISEIISYADGHIHKDLTLDSTKFKVSDVSKLSIGDTYNLWQPNYDTDYSLTITVIAIDILNNIISTDAEYNSTDISSYWIVETTLDTSTPVVKADGINGTWMNLATSDATYTIDTVPSDNTASIILEYSVNYAGGQGIEHVPKNVLEGKVNGQKLVKSDNGIVTIKANFEGKTQNNTDLNPHMAKEKHHANDISIPSAITEEHGDNEYDDLYSLGGDINIAIAENGGTCPLHLFSFNIIRAIQDKLGEGFFEGCVTIEDKVQRAKDRLHYISFYWHGYGESPNGNVAYLTKYKNGAWETGDSVFSHEADVVSILQNNIGATMQTAIDSNGFVHFLAYTDPSDGVTPSTIYTDYVELEIQIDLSEARYDVLVPENSFPVMTENLLTQNQAFPVEVVYGVQNKAVLEISDLGKVSLYIGEGANLGSSHNMARFDMDVIPSGNVTFSADVEIKQDCRIVANLYDNVTYSTRTDKTVKAGDKLRISVSKMIDENSTSRAFYLWASNVVNPVEGMHLFDFSNLKLEKDINPNPIWTPGRKSKTTLNYLGKTLGNDVSVPHKWFYYTGPDAPSVDILSAEHTQFALDQIGKQDGQIVSSSDNPSGSTRYEVFEFDLSHLGLSLSELKDKLRKLSISWTGYGQGYDGNELAYGANVKIWNTDTENWNVATSNTLETPSTLSHSIASDLSDRITNDQKVYILVHSTHPAGANSNSIVYTDYIKLDVELSEEVDYVKSNVVKVRKETKELKMEYPIKDYRTGITDSVALWYEYVPVPKPLESTKNVTVLAERDEILVSDLSSAVGDKQGIHHWMNPLYRVGNDSLKVFGEFGFANIPLAADSKNVNVGKSIQINGSGFKDYFITQYGISTLQKPMVGIIGNLVMHENELKLFVVSIYNETGLIDTFQNGVGLLLPIKGKPLVKLDKGERNPAIIPNAWRTKTGEIQGYLDQNGELILTYQ